MIAVPFVYFTVLTYYLWKKHQGFDVCVYMSSLYALTSLLCIVVYFMELTSDGGVLFDDNDIEISPIATILYCFFITLGILPFSLLYKKDLVRIVNSNPIITLAISILLISVSIINLYLVVDSTLEILSGDLSMIRREHYEGFESPADIKVQGMPYVLRVLYYFRSATSLAIPLFFYYLCFDKKPWWFLLLLAFTSLSTPIYGIQTADRTEMLFYFIMFTSCFILFHKFISKTIKLVIRIIALPIALLMIIYLGAVTEARFSERENGVMGSVVQYGGQNFLNFCYFWEHANYKQVAPEREFPFLSHYIRHIDSNAEQRAIRSAQQGFFISVFASYLGDIMIDLSPIGMIIWCMFFFLACIIIFRRPHREEITLGEYLMYFCLSAIPIFGIFYYRYTSYSYIYLMLIVLFIYFTEKYRFVLSAKKEDTDNVESSSEKFINS